MEYIKALAKKFDSKIISETGEEYTVDNIDKFDYEGDILYGIEGISSRVKGEDSTLYSIFGINRIVSFNQEMIDRIENSDSSIDTFSNMVKEIQYLDAFSANQRFFRNKENGKIVGAYTLTQNLRTILPYKPSVEFENSDMVKNEDIAFWNIGLVTIDGDENDRNGYNVAAHLDYDDFIKNLPESKYRFIDASYIMVEPLNREELLGLLEIFVN